MSSMMWMALAFALGAAAAFGLKAALGHLALPGSRNAQKLPEDSEAKASDNPSGTSDTNASSTVKSWTDAGRAKDAPALQELQAAKAVVPGSPAEASADSDSILDLVAMLDREPKRTSRADGSIGEDKPEAGTSDQERAGWPAAEPGAEDGADAAGPSGGANNANAEANEEDLPPFFKELGDAIQERLEDADSGLNVDMDKLGRRLFASNDPIALLKKQVMRIQKAERRADKDGGARPSAVASYLARGLDEAGLFDADAHWPSLTVVRPSRPKTFYLRVNEQSAAWRDMMRMLAIEGALNRALFAWERFEKNACPMLDEATIEDCYRFNQALASSICGQVGSSPIGHASMSDVVGEWGARQAISSGIESFRLPLRLQAQFRVNLMGGDAAIVATHIPWQAHPASVWSTDLGRIIPASRHMRERMAADHSMRVALLLASHAFRCSKRLCHVYVAVALDSPKRHACLLSGNVGREQLAELDLSDSFDAMAVCKKLGFDFRIEAGALCEVPQGFSLDSERFCPSSRYESPDLSTRILPRFESALLGAQRVNDLAINENARRDQVAQLACRALVPSTERSVRAILSLTKNDIDPTVREAGRRCAKGLATGTLSPDDVLSFSSEFVFGDELTRACERASELIEAGESSDAVSLLTDALAPIDSIDTYLDSDNVQWREFMSYVERALYNRLLAEEGHEIRLVPDAYYNAQGLMATALLTAGKPSQALGFAQRAQDLDPLNMPATLRVVRCLEVLGKRKEAADELRGALEYAFDPEGVGVAYYRLAFMEWQLGNINVADACYQKAISSRSSMTSTAMLELQAMRALTSSEGVEPADVEDVLERANIPLAPTERVLTVLVEAAQGATDAEVFPVARSFATLLRMLSGDDVMSGVLSSLEHEPDR